MIKPRVYNKHHGEYPKDAVYVGRPTKFGNPFAIKSGVSREECIELYKDWILNQPDLLREVRSELKGRDLVCWCAPKPCHADVLLKLANDGHVKRRLL